MSETNPNVVWVLIEGEPFLSRAKKYADDTFAMRVAWSKFAEIHGANGYLPQVGLVFGYSPRSKEWNAPKGRNAVSTPKRNSFAASAMGLLPREPKTWDVFGKALIYSIAYKIDDDNSGAEAIGLFFNGPPVNVTAQAADGTRKYVAYIPHARNAALQLRERYPDATITPTEALDWSIPEGLREITQAERDFIFAQARVEAERRGKEAA